MCNVQERSMMSTSFCVVKLFMQWYIDASSSSTGLWASKPTCISNYDSTTFGCVWFFLCWSSKCPIMYWTLVFIDITQNDCRQANINFFSRLHKLNFQLTVFLVSSVLYKLASHHNHNTNRFKFKAVGKLTWKKC